MITAIPFSGFYCSLWSGELDSIEEQEVKYYAEENAYDEKDVGEVVFQNCDYQKMYTDAVKAYLLAYEDWLSEAYDIEFILTFDTMQSPKEYNFTTDRIFAKVDIHQVRKLYEKLGKDAVAASAKKMFTSCDGFISYYSPNIDTWGALPEWDYNQVLAIFVAATQKDCDLAILEKLSEPFHDAFLSAVDWDKVAYTLANLDAPEDGKKFPRNVPAKDYDHAYNQLNGLKE